MDVIRIPGYPARAWTHSELETIARRFLQLHVTEYRLCLYCGEVGEECTPRSWARAWLAGRERTTTPGGSETGTAAGCKRVPTPNASRRVPPRPHSAEPQLVPAFAMLALLGRQM